jgi:DNA repair protein RadC
MRLNEFRKQYPQYSDIPDAELAQSLHKKFYSDLPFEDFSNRLGLAAPVGEVQSDTFAQTPEEMITPLGEPGEPLPIDNRPRIAAGPEPGILEGIANVFKRTKATYRDVATSYLTQTGAIDPTDAAFLLKENARRRGAAAPSMAVQEGMSQIAGAETYGDAVNAMLQNPSATFTMLVDSIVTSLPLVAPGLALAPAGALVAGTTAALGSGGLEYGAVMTDVLQDRGVDLSDPFAVTRALENPKIMGEIKEKGAKRGLIIGAFDGISVGLAGRFLNPTMDLIQAGKLSGAPAKKAFYANTAKELAIQTGLGAGGEFAAQVATGEDRPADVLLEGLAGLATAPIEVAASRRQAARAEEEASPPAPPPPPSTERIEPTIGPMPPAPPATPPVIPPPITPPVTPPVTPDEEITPFLEGELEGEEAAAPAAAVQLATQQEPPKTENIVAGLSPQEVPISALKLSQEVPQFKVDADVKGVVEPLGGKFERVGVAPIQVWKRLDGSLEVISGRHRFDLARRSSEKTMPAQIHDEAAGFTADKAAILDAELNIRDGQGKVKDYVGYFKGSGISKKEADTRGLLARPIGKRSFTIATDGTEDLIASHRADVIGDEAAYLIALNAPQDPALQAVGIKAIQDGKNTNTAVNLVQAVKTMSAERDTTADMFGFDESAMREAEEMAKLAARKQKEIQQRLSVMTGASKNPELARKEGIDIKDPDAVRQRIDELRSAKASWDTWSSSPELIGQIRRELRGEPEPIETVTPPVDEDTISMFGDEPPRAASDVDQLATEFPNVPRDLFEGVGSFAKVKPYIQAAYNKGNLKQVETILNSLRKAAPPIGQVREDQKEIDNKTIKSTSGRLYHGTGSDFDTFDFNFNGGMAFFGDQKNIALKYAYGGGGQRLPLSNKDKYVINGRTGVVYEMSNNVWNPIGIVDENVEIINQSSIKPLDKKYNSLTIEEAQILTDEMSGEGVAIPKTARIVEVDVQNLNLLDVTSPEGRDVIANLQPTTNKGAQLVEAANFDRRNKDDTSLQFNSNFWSTTKFANAHKDALRQDIVEPLKRMGYDGIYFQDDQNKSYALFDTPKVKKQLKDSEFLISEPTSEEKRLADLERDLFRLTPPAIPERRAAPSAQADLFGVAGLESLPDRPQLQKQKRQNNQQLSLFGSQVIDSSENNTAGRKARKAAIDEVKALQETDTTMGLSFANEFAQKQRANLVGQKINSASDLAVLSQVYRDPSFETFRLFFTDADNNVISQLGVTSRLPGSSNAIIGNDLNKYLVEVQKAAKDVGAVGFWMLHNHPSGNVQSSGADRVLTKTFNKYMPGMNFLGHVIIDTNKYGLILPDGTYTEISKDMNQKDLVDFQLGSYETVFNPIEMAKKVDEDQDAMVVVVMNNSLQVTGITSLPNSDFVGKTPEQIQRRLMKTALRGMGSRLLVASRNRTALDAVASSVENGIHIKDNGQYENFNQMFKYRTILTFPLSRPGVVTADSSKLFDFLRKPKVADPGRSKYLNWTDLRVLEREPVTIRVEEPQDNLFGDDAQTLKKLDETLPKAKKKLPPGRSPELAELAERLSRNEITKEEWDDAVNRYRPIPIYEEALKPATEQEVVNALSSDKQPKANAAIPDGTRVGLRLDIPAWNNHKTFVVSIHEGKPRVTSPSPGKSISYRSTAVAKNVKFGVGNQRKSLDIAIGNAKDAMQTMEGEFVNLSPEETYRRAQEAINDANYVQIGFDPTRHAYFYDRLTTLPVESAGEVIQIGNMILAKDVEFGDKETFLYNITEDQSHLFEGEGVEKVDSIPAGVKKKVKKGRSPELTEMAEKLKRGEITKEDYDEAVNKFSRPALYAEIPKPATDKAVVDALSSDKRPYANVAISNGTKVGLRLDIPAFERYGVGVVSIHQAKPSLTSPKADKILSYRSVAGLKNVKFALGDQTKALNTAAGEFKDKLQTMEGEYVNYTPEEVFAKAQEVLNDPEYIQVGFNPIRHSYFYDRLTMLPVVSANEVIQIGQLVMAKGVEFGDKADFLYSIGDPTARSNKEVDQSVDVTRKEIINFYQGIRQRRASLVKKIEKGEVSIDVQRRLQELNELGKEMQLDARIMYEPNLSARAFRNRAEKAYLDDEIGADVLGVIETMLAKYPKLLEGLQLSVKTDKTLGDAAGQFNPIKRLVTLYKDTSGAERPMTIRHELSHAMEQMMPIGAREAVIREWSKAFQAAIKKHKDAKSQEYFQRVLEFLDRPSKARMEAATRAMPSYDFYQYLNPSEYWAINAEKLMAAQLGTPWNRFVKAMQRLLEGIKKILGFNNKYTTHKVFDQIIGGSMKRLDRGSLLDYMIEGDTDIDFLMDVKKVDDLMDKYKRPDTPTDTSGSVKDMFMGSYEKAKQIAADIKESPLAPISKMVSNIDRAITYARNKNIWFGTGLNQADFTRYNGQLRDSHKNVVASIAVDNAIHAGHVAVQVAMLGKLKYDNNIGMFTAVQDEKSMKNVIKLKAQLVKQLGAQRAANVMNGYFEAKRSRNIIDEYLQREANYEQAMAEIDLSGTQNPADIKEAKDELESIERAAEKVLMTDNEIDDFIALENEYPQLREMMENWQSVNRNLLDNMFFARIIGKRRYNKLKSIKDYVPWYRITDDMEDIHMPTAGAIRGLTDVPRERLFRKGVPQMTREILSKDGQQDFNVRMNPDAEVFVDNVKVDPSLYRLRPDRTLRFNDPIRGGQNVKVIQNRPIDNIIDNMLHNVMITTKNVMRNYAALKVSQAYGTRNEKGKLKVFATEGADADGVRFNVRIDGRKVIHQIKDPLIAESVLGLENFELPVNGILSYFANGFRRSITAFPAFQLKQLFMDAPTAAWVSGVKNPYKLWASVFSSFIAALNPNDPITQILRSKGIGGFQYAFRSPQKELEIEIGVIKGNLFSMAMKVLDKIGDASDIAQRRAIYIQLMKETKGDETLALSMAQNVIDFLRRGSGVPAQFVTRTVAFAGAYAQAIDVLARTLAGGGLKGMDRKIAIANMVKNGMLLGAVTVLYTWAVGDDEEYQKLDDQTRARGFFIPGSKEVFGEPLILPMSTGASFFFKTVPEIAYNQVMRDGTETKMDETRLRTALSQAATDALLGPNMSPTAVKPFIEIALNRNFFTGTNMIPRGLEDVEAAEQYNATTSELGKVVSSLTSVPGTEKRLLAPIEADHLVRSLFGTVGATAMWGTNLLVEDRVDSRMRDNPLYGPFFLPPVPRGREDLFYDLKDRVDKKYETYTTKLDRGKDDEAEEYFDKNEDLIVQRDTTEQIARILQEINKEIRLVGTSEDLGLSKKERTEMIRELQEEKNDVIDDITEIRREAGL